MKKLLDEVPDLSVWLNDIAKQAREMGCTDFMCVASHPDHPLGGGSSSYYTIKPYRNNPIYLCRETLIKWEEKNGMDPDHDWFKK